MKNRPWRAWQMSRYSRFAWYKRCRIYSEGVLEVPSKIAIAKRNLSAQFTTWALHSTVFIPLAAGNLNWWISKHFWKFCVICLFLGYFKLQKYELTYLVYGVPFHAVLVFVTNPEFLFKSAFNILLQLWSIYYSYLAI